MATNKEIDNFIDEISNLIQDRKLSLGEVLGSLELLKNGLFEMHREKKRKERKERDK